MYLIIRFNFQVLSFSDFSPSITIDNSLIISMSIVNVNINDNIYVSSKNSYEVGNVISLIVIHHFVTQILMM